MINSQLEPGFVCYVIAALGFRIIPLPSPLPPRARACPHPSRARMGRPPASWMRSGSRGGGRAPRAGPQSPAELGWGLFFLPGWCSQGQVRSAPPHPAAPCPRSHTSPRAPCPLKVAGGSGLICRMAPRQTHLTLLECSLTYLACCMWHILAFITGSRAVSWTE